MTKQRACIHCKQDINQKDWLKYNVLTWHSFCPGCKKRIFIFRKKDPKETWRLIGSMVVGFALFKLIGQSLSIFILTYLTKRIPFLKWFWQHYQWVFILVTFLISYLIFRLMYLTYIHKNVFKRGF